MRARELVAIYGMGPDGPGLVGTIAKAIAARGGNIVDLSQGAAHGLFSLTCVVAPGPGGIEALRSAVAGVAEATGLALEARPFAPVRREAGGAGMLAILIGPDGPGIIGEVAEALGSHGINIDESRMVAREGIFLMEIFADLSACPLPEPNVKRAVAGLMDARGIRSLFQFDDVFNKRKRLIVLCPARGFLPPKGLAELAAQTGIPAAELSGASGPEEAAAMLEGCPSELLQGAAGCLRPSRDTVELLNALKAMGYRVGVTTGAFSCLAASLASSVGRGMVWGPPLEIDADTRCATGRLEPGYEPGFGSKRFVAELLAREGIGVDDGLVLDGDPARFPSGDGIRLEFDPRFILDAFNRKALSREALAGICSSLSFGGRA